MIIDTCPDNIACIGGHLIQENMLVSSLNDGRIFLNKHCALCHGVNTTLEWNLIVQNCPITLLANITSLGYTILNECFLKFIPPTALEHMAKQYECVRESDVISSCNTTGGFDACEKPSIWRRHTFYIHRDAVYSSRDCFVCNYNSNQLDELCRPLDETKGKIPFEMVSFSVLLDNIIFKKETKPMANCAGYQIYNPFFVSKF